MEAKILIADKHKPLEERLKKAGIGYVAAKRERAIIAEHIKDAKVFIADKQVPPTREELESAGNLRLVHTGTGYDFMTKEFPGAMEYLTSRNIPIASTPGVVAPDVAETIFKLIHDVTNLGLGITMDEQTFDKGKSRMRLRGKTFGSVGYGNIGFIACEIAVGYGMNVFALREHPQKGLGQYTNHPRVSMADDLSSLLKKADIVSLHVPETTETKGMIGYEQFALMKPTAYFINTARGRITDELALVRALDEGLIAGAGIDVYSGEPLHKKNPELSREFMRLVAEGKMICTPHIASNSIEGEIDRAAFYFENIERVIKGEPPTAIVNLEYRK